MSIQRRLATSITFVLLFSLLIGCGLSYEHVLSKVRTELQAALSVGAYSALNSLGGGAENDPAAALRRVVGEFNGDRHLRAVLTAPDGTIVQTSQILPPDEPAPAWFSRLLDAQAPRTRLTLPPRYRPVGSLSIAADPRNEIAEAWGDIKLTLTVMAVFFAAVLVLALLTIQAALRPVRDVSAALARIGTGDYQTRIEPGIARELAPLREGFNAMAARLQEVERQNRALNEQVTTLQEEERAELARDLHDEIGPFLFAVGADVAMIRQFVQKGTLEEIEPRAEAINEAVRHMQRHLREALRRLAPGALLDLGLDGAIDNLFAFWRARRADIVFSLTMLGDPLDPPFDAVAYRIVQESLSNAIRHGNPRTIDVVVEVDETLARVTVEDDGKGFDGEPTPGFGLKGMQERVRALGGGVRFGNRVNQPGVRVVAEWSLAGARPAETTVLMDVQP